jgi:hypothetical protein
MCGRNYTTGRRTAIGSNRADIWEDVLCRKTYPRGGALALVIISRTSALMVSFPERRPIGPKKTSSQNFEVLIGN